MRYYVEIKSGTTIGFSGVTDATSPRKAASNIFFRWARRKKPDNPNTYNPISQGRVLSSEAQIFYTRMKNAGYEPWVKVEGSSSPLTPIWRQPLGPQTAPKPAPKPAPAPAATPAPTPTPKQPQQLSLPFESRLDKALTSI